MTKANAAFVIGHSPAILTETLAAASERDSIEIEKIRVVSTSTGAQLLKQRLFDQGGWSDFIQIYPTLAKAKFSCADILAMDCDDIRSAADNRKVAEAVMGLIREFTAEGQPMLLASIAGGRKTMGYYMGFALSLFGRPGDRLTHVLVPEEWERDRTFLIPEIGQADRVDLVDIPFIRLRDFLTSDIANASVEQLVFSAQSVVDVASRPDLFVDYDTREIEFDGRRCKLPVREFVFFRFFLRQKSRHCRYPELPSCDGCSACYLDWGRMSSNDCLEDLHDIRRQYRKGSNDPEVVEFRKRWDSFEVFRSAFPEVKNRLNNQLKQAFGFDARSKSILLQSVRTDGYARYGLAVDKNQIKIEG